MDKPITRRKIEQYNSLQREIIMLEEQIITAEMSGDEYLSDVVQGSSKEPPYTKHSIVITGYGSRAIPRLLERKRKLENDCDAIEKIIESVHESVMRQILTRRYIENRSLKDTAGLVGYSGKQVKRLIQNFFEKMSPNVP